MNSAILLAAVCSLQLGAQTDFSGVEKSAREEIAKLKIPGASIAIVQGDQIVYSKAVGTANAETDEAVRPEMLFRLGSTTKMFTASALVGLAVQGKIDLNAPVGKYLDFLPPRLSKITANQLLSHTAGIRDEAPMYGSHDDAALGNGIRAWTDAWLFTSPGKIISYSNPGYWMAGYLVEKITATPYADAMESRVFKPLGMTRTTLRPTVAMTFPLAQGHDFSDGTGKIARPAADNVSGWPAGSIFSNTHDLVQFVIAFMNEGRLNGKQVIDPKVIALMSAPHAAIPGGSNSYCYGLETGELRGVREIGHSGSRMGYGSQIMMVPEQRVGVVVQTNRSGATLPATIETAVGLLVPLGPKGAVENTPAMKITDSDLARDTGIFQNGEQRIEITARNNRLFLKRGEGKETELVKHGDASFAAGNGKFTMIAGADGKVEYVHSGLRSFARVP